MKTTAVPLPDAVYEQVEILAASRHLTVPELLREAVEELVSPQATPAPKTQEGWQFPAARHLGDIRVPAEELRLLANEAAS